MSGWKKYFSLKRVAPGPVVFHGIGKVDFSRDDLAVDLVKRCYDHGSGHLVLTDAGRVLFSEEATQPEKTAREVVKLIKTAESINEARAYAALKSGSVTVEKALSQKIDQILELESYSGEV